MKIRIFAFSLQAFKDANITPNLFDLVGKKY